MTLHEFLKLPHRFRWGGMDGDDCMTFTATWALELTGIDPAQDVRGTYRTKDEAWAIIEARGGHLSCFAGFHEAIGAKRVQSPSDGDIGLVMMMAGETYEDAKITEVGAIRFGPLWASLSPAGVVMRQSECIAAWRLPA